LNEQLDPISTSLARDRSDADKPWIRILRSLIMKNTAIDRRKQARLVGPWSWRRLVGGVARDQARQARALRPLLEDVERRLLLSGAFPTITATPLAIRLGSPTASPSDLTPDGSASPGAYTPAEFQQAYGFDQVQFGYGVKGNGAGQTIAIVDEYNDPDITGDLKAFDSQFNLPAPPSFKVVAQDGSANLPGVDPTGSWEVEESLDVEWAHAMAPGASILLVEANSYSNLFGAVKFAAGQPGVSVVSMSWGGGEYSGETSTDSDFTTPSGHAPVTFVAASGDSGTILYPAASHNVLGVGGTLVTLASNNNISSETAWSGSGGGVSQYESLPSYQDGVVPKGTTKRESPDVAYNAGYGVSVYDTYNYGTKTPWASIGGTSAGAPQWSAIIAIANQGRALYGLPTLNGPSQTLPLLYSASSLDFNDITSGSNKGYSAGIGYDMVTGLGSPKADFVVYSLIGQNFYLSNGVLTVNGDQLGANYKDSVTLGLTSSGGEQVTLNGMTVQFTRGTVTSVDVITDGGNNTVNVDATAAGIPVSIDMLGGTGTVNIAPSSEYLGNIQGNVSVTGGNSADVLNIFDENNPSQATYSITSSTVTRSGAAAISYDSAASVNLYGGSGNDTYNIESTASGEPVSIQGGAGNDTFNVSPTAKNLSNIQGALTVWGLGGSNSLNVFDQNDTAAATYSITSSTVTRSGAAAISYDSVASVNLYGGSGNDTYNIESTASGEPVLIEGGAGNDTFNVSPSAKNLETIGGPLTVWGFGGSNSLNVFDQNNTGAATYSVTSSSVTRAGTAAISYASVNSVNLDGGSGNDTYNIESTASGTPVSITAGAGNDIFRISPTAKNLNTIQGNVSIVGGSGTNSLFIYDQAYTGTLDYSVTSSTVTRAGAATITYSSIQNMTLYSGS
jgi:hypothetical protein